MSNQPLLKVEALCKTFRFPSGDVAVLKGVDLSVNAGESVAITGPSGSGKSTLLNIIGTLDRPTTGQVLLGGRDILAGDEKHMAEARSRLIGFVFQFHHLLPQFTVLENVLLPTVVTAADRSAAGARATRLLDRVGLSHRLNHRPGELSGGERQRVAVVRALMNSPKLVLADEPTGSLDRAGSEGLAHLLVEINREEGAALIVVTHSPQLAASMQRSCVLRDGRLEARQA